MKQYLPFLALVFFFWVAFTVYDLNQSNYDKHNPTATAETQKMLDDVYLNGWILTISFILIGLAISFSGYYSIQSHQKEVKV